MKSHPRRRKNREINQTLPEKNTPDFDEKISGRPCPEIFNRTLQEKFQAPPQPLHKIREPINQTLHEKIRADPGSKKLNKSGKEGISQMQSTQLLLLCCYPLRQSLLLSRSLLRRPLHLARYAPLNLLVEDPVRIGKHGRVGDHPG